MASKQQSILENFVWFTLVYYYLRLTIALKGAVESL